MKKLKYLLALFCLGLMPRVVNAEMHLICPSSIVGGNTLSCALEVTDKYKSITGTLDIPSTVKYVGIYGGTYTNLSAENGLYLRKWFYVSLILSFTEIEAYINVEVSKEVVCREPLLAVVVRV